MFSRETSPQSAADVLKAMIDGVHSRNDDVRAAQAAALDKLQIFERCDWHGSALDDAIAVATPGKIMYSTAFRAPLAYKRPDGPRAPAATEHLQMLQTITTVLDAYIRAVAPCAEPTP